MTRIVLPQALISAEPSLFNNLVDIIKGTSLAFSIGVIEMTATARLRASVTFNYLESYIALMIAYWILIVVLERIQAYIEKKISVFTKK